MKTKLSKNDPAFQEACRPLNGCKVPFGSDGDKAQRRKNAIDVIAECATLEDVKTLVAALVARRDPDYPTASEVRSMMADLFMSGPRVTCRLCDGKGYSRGGYCTCADGIRVSCPECHGTGHRPTEIIRKDVDDTLGTWVSVTICNACALGRRMRAARDRAKDSATTGPTLQQSLLGGGETAK